MARYKSEISVVSLDCRAHAYAKGFSYGIPIKVHSSIFIRMHFLYKAESILFPNDG